VPDGSPTAAAPPLAGVRVLAVEQYGAGPFGSLHLADLGADVIKIEDPGAGGDVGRTTPPYTTGSPATGDHDSLFFQAFNRDKRSVALDLAHPDGRAVFEDLVRHADAVSSNLRGDVPARLRITYADLAPVNPRIVCCSLSGYGTTGPRAGQPGYDYLLQGLAGWMSLTGEPDGIPTKTGPSLVDYAGGMAAALALVAGVHAASRTGVGTDCDVSLYDTAMSLLGYVTTWHLDAGYAPTRTRHSAHPSIVPFQNLRTADSWIVVACPKEKFWRLLVGALDHPDWADDPRFATMAARSEHADQLLPLLEAEIVRRTTDEWIDVLTAAGVPCAPVRTVEEALADPHTAARELVVTTGHPVWGELRHVRTAARAGAPRRDHAPAPLLGANTDAVLAELCGYDAARIAALRAAGAFGPVAG
jgi:crotonobetainyl-CoA:carnitine CoA-transferase CaiB-like acyl-CoA transferase